MDCPRIGTASPFMCLQDIINYILPWQIPDWTGVLDSWVAREWESITQEGRAVQFKIDSCCGKNNKICSSPKRPDEYWGWPRLLISVYRRSLPGVKREEREVTHLYLVQTLRMNGDMTAFCYANMPSWHRQEYI
jgi:hypothetical protein